MHELVALDQSASKFTHRVGTMASTMASTIASAMPSYNTPAAAHLEKSFFLIQLTSLTQKTAIFSDATSILRPFRQFHKITDDYKQLDLQDRNLRQATVFFLETFWCGNPLSRTNLKSNFRQLQWNNFD